MARELEGFRSWSCSIVPVIRISCRDHIFPDGLDSQTFYRLMSPKLIHSGESTMKTRDSVTYLQAISVSLVLSVMFVLPCATFAQPELTVRYRAVEDPGQRLISWHNVALAIAFAFDSNKFDDLWPDYGYNYDVLHSSIERLCQRGNTDFSIGRSAIIRNNPIQSTQASDIQTFVALRMANGMDPRIVENFLKDQGTQNPPASQADRHVGSNQSEDDSQAVTIEGMCRILSEVNPIPEDTVIVTQHPLPVPDRYTYRLLKQ